MAVEIITWLQVIMRCVLMTALGIPVEPDVKRNFAGASGSTAASAFSTASVGTVASMSSKVSEANPAAGLRATTSPISGVMTDFSAGSKGFPSAAKTSPGVSSEKICFSFSWSLETSE